MASVNHAAEDDEEENNSETFLLGADDAFSSLPDFLSSPSSSSPESSNFVSVHQTTSSSSNSPSRSPWFFLKVSDASINTQETPVVTVPDFRVEKYCNDKNVSESSEGFDFLGDIDLGNNSDHWEYTRLFSEDQQIIDAVAADHGSTAKMVEESPSSSEELMNVFFNWLKSNKEVISPEDLRRIKLKKSTIESAARRLGGGKQAMKKLLKLILDWVQCHHLNQKKKFQNIAGEEFQDDEWQLQHQFSSIHDQSTNTNYDQYSYDTEQNYMLHNSWVHRQSSYEIDSSSLPSQAIMNYAVDPYSAVTDQTFGLDQFNAVEQVCPFPYNTQLPLNYSGFSSQYPGQLFDQRISSLASATREARKKRMARQRRLSSLHQHRIQKHHQRNHRHHDNEAHHQLQLQLQLHQQHNYFRNNSTAAHMDLGSMSSEVGTNYANQRSTANWCFWQSLPSSSYQFNPVPDSGVPSVTPSSNIQAQVQSQIASSGTQNSTQRNSSSSEKRQGLKVEKNLRFLLQKVLKQSDVGSLGRIVLPKKEAEIHLPELDTRDGISIAMEDIGTSRVWNMRYRFWPNNKSRMYLLENTGDFIRSNELQEGDFIVIYADVKCGKYMIRGIKVRQPAEVKGGSSRTTVRIRNSSANRSSSKAKSNNSSIDGGDKMKKKLSISSISKSEDSC